MKKQFYCLAVLSLLFVSCHQKTWEERCAEEAKNYTYTHCPQNMGNGIVLDSLTYDAGQNCNTYYYSVHDELDNDSIFQAEAENFKAVLSSQIANSVELKEKKDHGTLLRYVYTSASTGKTLLEFK